MKAVVVYWSATGNTEKMAELIAEGMQEKGAEVTVLNVADASVDEVLDYDVIALGCPSMGVEVLEEDEMEGFVEDIEGGISGKTLGLFGSFDWGDGEWMRNWVERMNDAGANVVGEGLIVHLTPEDDDENQCIEYGKKIIG